MTNTNGGGLSPETEQLLTDVGADGLKPAQQIELLLREMRADGAPESLRYVERMEEMLDAMAEAWDYGWAARSESLGAPVAKTDENPYRRTPVVRDLRDRLAEAICAARWEGGGPDVSFDEHVADAILAIVEQEIGDRSERAK